MTQKETITLIACICIFLLGFFFIFIFPSLLIDFIQPWWNDKSEAYDEKIEARKRKRRIQRLEEERIEEELRNL